MVNEVVSIKKPFNWKKLLIWIFIIFFVLIIILGIFVVGMIFGNDNSEPNIEINIVNPISEIMVRLENQKINVSQEEVIEQASLEFDSEYIDYVLYAMSAYKLKNPPFSSETPKIRVVLGDEIYYSEVIEGEVFTYSDSVGEDDISITSTKEEIINAMLAEDMTEFMSESVRDGNTQIEMLAGNIKLATKGYLQMYQDITGEALI